MTDTTPIAVPGLTCPGIHPSAIVAEGVELGAGVSVGPYTIIHRKVEIGSGSVIGSHCEIGLPTPRANGARLVIGARSTIRSHSVFYAGSTIGEGLTTGHSVTVRELTQAGPGLQVGTLSDIQGDCQIGNYVRTHSSVFIAQRSIIGDYVWLFPGATLTDDPHPPSNHLLPVRLERFSAIGARSVLLPGVVVGEGALVGGGSVVTRNVSPHTLVAGNPAREFGATTKILLRDGSGRPAYPWPSHFRRGYPDCVIRDFEDFLRASEFASNVNPVP